jgi:two-component system LytT family response regulator
MPLVVFVTAYDEYAIQAFEVHAVDYLLKPFDADRVAAALDKVRVRLAAREGSRLAERFEQVLASLGAGRDRPTAIPVRIGERIELVRMADIDWVEAESNYVTIHAGPRELVIRETLGSLERKLDPKTFARVHRSHIVNLSRVTQLHPRLHGEYELVLADGTRIGTGRTYTHVVQRLTRGLS